jgi:uncharacterized protein (TIGR02145 family)
MAKISRIRFFPLVLSLLTISCEKEEEQSTVTDIDGNVYKTVQIGDQRWMAENLRVTHYLNGDPISNVTEGKAWCSLSTGAFCDYFNNSGNSKTYGKLYNWFAVVNTSHLCPSGWHVPTNAEWKTLTDNLGGGKVACGKLKEKATTHWHGFNRYATNEYGFTALPGGYRFRNGTFFDIGSIGYWWSSTEYNSTNALCRHIDYRYIDVFNISIVKRTGCSVRCIRDN